MHSRSLYKKKNRNLHPKETWSSFVGETSSVMCFFFFFVSRTSLQDEIKCTIIFFFFFFVNSSPLLWIPKTNKVVLRTWILWANCQESGQTHHYKHCQPLLLLRLENGVVSVNLECAGRKRQDKEGASVMEEERMKERQGQSKSKLESAEYKTVPLGGRLEKMNVWAFSRFSSTANFNYSLSV